MEHCGKKHKLFHYRNNGTQLANCSSMKGDASYWNNVEKWMRAPGYERNPQDWQLWIYSSKLSLNAVIHSGNDSLSTLLVTLYTWKRLLLNCIQCDKYSWNICACLKATAHPCGVPLGCIKSRCFLMWRDSEKKSGYYAVREWPYRKQLLPAQKNTANDSLVDPKKIFPPQFHLKFKLMKTHVKAMNWNGESFRCLL